MKAQKIISIFGILSLFLLTTQILAQMQRDFRPCEDFIFEDMNLSTEQQDQLTTIKKDHMDSMKKINSEIGDLRFQLNKKLDEKIFNEQEINKIVDNLMIAHRKEILARVDLIKKTKAILTEEQNQKLNFRMLWQCGGGPNERGIRGGQNFIPDEPEDSARQPGKNPEKNEKK
jgi:Spy/CpxP family protein refolding chaperone